VANSAKREKLLNGLLVATARAQTGLWLAKLEEWGDAENAPVSLKRELGVWNVKALAGPSTVFSSSHASLTVAVSQVLRQILVSQALPRPQKPQKR
jgi:hypothetical protein